MEASPIRINLNCGHDSLSGLPWLKHDSNQRKGAEIADLYQNGAQRIALVRFHPSAHAEAHIHHGFESILVLEGGYSDSMGRYTQGDLVIYPDGSVHNWTSENGALLYVVWGGETALVDKES
ncbi:cupin domain-containing protein [Marinobacter shengliensis]